jgi:CMP-2-keto-3-deoxyoctulosonic acid synthetase
VVLKAVSVDGERTALTLGHAVGGVFLTRHNHLGGGHILATVAPSLGFHCLKVVVMLQTVVCHVQWKMVIKLCSTWQWLL